MCNKTTVLFFKSQDFWPPYRDSLSAPIQPIGSRLGLGLDVAKNSRRPRFHPLEGLETALADVTNLTLILDLAPILIPCFKLSYFVFGLSLDRGFFRTVVV
jgi:hypothetical protein